MIHLIVNPQAGRGKKKKLYERDGYRVCVLARSCDNEERDEYKRNLARIARASNLTFGEISAVTGLPKDIVVAAHCKSCRKPHKPQYPKFSVQLVYF